MGTARVISQLPPDILLHQLAIQLQDTKLQPLTPQLRMHTQLLLLLIQQLLLQLPRGPILPLAPIQRLAHMELPLVRILQPLLQHIRRPPQPIKHPLLAIKHRQQRTKHLLQHILRIGKPSLVSYSDATRLCPLYFLFLFSVPLVLFIPFCVCVIIVSTNRSLLF